MQRPFIALSILALCSVLLMSASDAAFASHRDTHSTAIAPASPPPGATILFQEDFDDGFAPGFGNEVGDWQVQLLYPYTGMYTATTGTYRFSMAGDPNWQNYVVEADFLNAKDGGLLVRSQNHDNCIALIVRPSGNDIYWHIRKGGSWGAALEGVTLGHGLGEELHVKVDVVGSQFKAYVNGELKTTLETTEFPRGKMGLYLYYQQDQYWDNVVVYSTGGSTPTPPTTELAVDVWTDKGGEGANMPGGTYNVGEEIILSVKVNTACETITTLDGPSMTDSIEASLGTGTYDLSLGQAEEADIGQWQIVLEAWSDGQYASDTVRFSIVGTEPASTAATISASPSIVAPGGEITVTYSGAPGFHHDWIAIYEVGDPNEWYGERDYLYGQKSNSLVFTAPEEPGDYEFRLFENDGFTDIASSNVVKVQSGVPTPAPPSPTAEAGLVTYYPLDGDTGDHSGNGYDGINYGAAFVPGISGQALSFDGTDDYVQTRNNFDSSSISIFAWVNPSASMPNGWRGIAYTALDKSTGGWWLGYNKGAGLACGLGPNYVPRYDSSQNLAEGQWSFVGFIIDDSAKTGTCYYNGASVGSFSYASLYSGGNLWIGRGNDGVLGDEMWYGLIDEVRIYNYALSASQIESLYREHKVPGEPSPPPTPPTTPSTPTTPVTPAPPGLPTLIFESRSKSSGSTVQIPLTLRGGEEEIGNIDITLGYNPYVLEATEVIKGGLTANSLFDYNILDGTIRISLADNQGFSGDGSIAQMKFNVIGAAGSSSPLSIVAFSANRAIDSASMNIGTQDGSFMVLSVEEARGDYDGDGKITALDALCALQMAVDKRAEDLAMDVTRDNKVSSVDARKILRAAQGLEGLS